VDTILRVAAALADGSLVVDAGQSLAELRAGLLAVKGIGPWTVEYVAMRALGDPDAFPSTDLVLKRAMTESAPDRSESWRPWRAYAAMHLWNATTEETT
jgi:AraC family transcriptional regulator of adaptative response / DNA-3-methyladenine glycosylase II